MCRMHDPSRPIAPINTLHRLPVALLERDARGGNEGNEEKPASPLPALPPSFDLRGGSIGGVLKGLFGGGGRPQVAYAIVALPQPEPEQGRVQWLSVDDPGAFADGFNGIRLVVDAALTSEQVGEVTACLDYALREAVLGEPLALPIVEHIAEDVFDFTVLEWGWMSEECRRVFPNFRRAFELAWCRVLTGTPVHTTNNTGPGTRGTRDHAGIGDNYSLAFYVRHH